MSVASGAPGTDEFPDNAVGIALTALDSSLRCSICYGILDTPLMLKGCGHTFCSSCIRANLDFQEKAGQPACPSCRRPCDARDLLPCHALREACARFAEARPLLARALAQAAAKEAATRAEADAAEARGARARDGQPEDDDVDVVEIVEAPPAETPSASGVDQPSGPLTRSRSGAGSTSAAKSPQRARMDDPGDEDWTSSSESEGVVSSQEPSPAKLKRRRVGSSKEADRVKAGPGDGKHPGKATESGHQPEAEPTSESTRISRGFVDCPVCGRSVPSFYINSHVDACLSGHGPKAAPPEQAEPDQARAEAQAPPASAAAEPLALPPKLVPTFLTDKALRQLLKRFCLPTDGRRAEMVARYTRLRREVEVANDRGERTSYARLARRVLGAERQVAAATLLGGGAPAEAHHPCASGGRAAVVDLVGGGRDVLRDTTNSDGFLGDSWRELVEATRRRDAARKALRAEAGPAADKEAPDRAQESPPSAQAVGGVLATTGPSPEPLVDAPMV